MKTLEVSVEAISGDPDIFVCNSNTRPTSHNGKIEFVEHLVQLRRDSESHKRQVGVLIVFKHKTTSCSGIVMVTTEVHGSSGVEWCYCRDAHLEECRLRG